MSVSVRAVLMGAGLVAMGLVRHPAPAGAAPFSPSVVGSPQSSPDIADTSVLTREPGPRNVGQAHRHTEDEATANTDIDDDATGAGPHDSRWTPADVLYMRDHASARARCIIDREIGGFGYDPWRQGAAGERGPVQLHPRGLLPEYLIWSGGQAPENPYFAIPFLEYKLGQGQGRYWSPVRLGLC